METASARFVLSRKALQLRRSRWRAISPAPTTTIALLGDSLAYRPVARLAERWAMRWCARHDGVLLGGSVVVASDLDEYGGLRLYVTWRYLRHEGGSPIGAPVGAPGLAPTIEA